MHWEMELATLGIENKWTDSKERKQRRNEIKNNIRRTKNCIVALCSDTRVSPD